MKYIAPNAARIRKGIYRRVPLESLEAWETIMGFQFETLMLDNLDEILTRLGLKNRAVLNAGPYAQAKTARRKACQIDLLIRTRQCVYLVEMKCRGRTGPEVIDVMREKVKRLSLPKDQAYRTVLLHTGSLDPAVEDSDYFDFILHADEWVAG